MFLKNSKEFGTRILLISKLPVVLVIVLWTTDWASSLQSVWRILSFLLLLTVWLYHTLVWYTWSQRRKSSGCSFPDRILNFSLYSVPPFGSAIFIFWTLYSSDHSWWGPNARGSLLLNLEISVCLFPGRRVEIIQKLFKQDGLSCVQVCYLAKLTSLLKKNIWQSK